ncbi:hypothetical protein EMIT0158MI4_20531 [Burkholderia ambifaria]
MPRPYQTKSEALSLVFLRPDDTHRRRDPHSRIRQAKKRRPKAPFRYCEAGYPACHA